MKTNELINDFLSVSFDVKKLAENFLNLSYNQINWRPSDSQWSIGECIEHLIRTNVKYIPVYEKNKLPDGSNDKVIYKQSILGKLILKTVKPDYKRKMKTPSSFNPSKFQEKITSPFSKLVRYNIGESLLIVAYHNLRHLHQAMTVKQNEKFPAS